MKVRKKKSSKRKCKAKFRPHWRSGRIMWVKKYGLRGWTF